MEDGNFVNMDAWLIYSYIQAKTAILANQLLDFFPALLDSPPWMIFIAVVLIVAPIIWLLVKLIQWIRTSTDDQIRAVKVFLEEKNHLNHLKNFLFMH